MKRYIDQNSDITELSGDIFDKQIQLVNYVSQEMTLKERLSLEFRRQFGNLDTNKKNI